MTKSFLARILRPIPIFIGIIVLALAVTSVAFAQTGTPYALTASDVVCADEALTQSCITSPGTAVELVPFSDGVVQVYVNGQLAGYMKTPVQQVVDVAVPTIDRSASPVPNFNLGDLWAPIGNRFAEVWALGWFHALFLLVSAIAIPLLPPIENKIEERAWLNGYYIKFVAGIAVSILIQYLTLHGKLDWLLTWLVSKTNQQWIPGAFNWILGVGTLVAIWYGTRVILAESGTSTAVDQEQEPEPIRFSTEGEMKEYMENTMPKEMKAGIRKGYNPKADKPYWLIVVAMKETAKQDRSYLTSTLFLIWIVLEIFGTYITTIRTSLVGLDLFDVIPLYALYVQWREEIFNEFGGSWSRVLQTLLVGILVGGMYLIITTLADLIPPTNWWAFLRGLPREVAGLFLPFLYLLMQGKGRYAVGTTDLLSGILMGTWLLAQIFAKVIFG